MIKNIFKSEVVNEVVARIERLSTDSRPQWGTMSVSQMLAHCNVTYEMVFDDKHKKPNALVRLLLKTFVKKGVVNDVPYKQSLKTAPQFIIKSEKDFSAEKKRLIAYIERTKELGESYFHNKESLSFGVLSRDEWNNMFYKHLDHHLKQFGV